jgi:hypothetical protein
MPTVTLELPTRQASPARWAAVAFVASYSSPGTRQAYGTQLRLWFDWCSEHQLDPLVDARRPHLTSSSTPATSRRAGSHRPRSRSSWS